MPMVFYRLLRSLLGTLLVLWLVLTITFAMLRHIPGGPFDAERELPPQALGALRNFQGEDRSLLGQYCHYLGRVVRGDLGPSLRQIGWSVRELLVDKWAVSCELGAYAMALACCCGIVIGCAMQLDSSGRTQRIGLRGCTLLLCIPNFILGPLLNYLFTYRLHWFPSVGWHGWSSKILPVCTLAPCYLAVLAQLTWQGMAMEYGRAYVQTARAKGLAEWQIFFRHVFFNGIQPAIAYIGPTCAGVLSGTFVVENVFHVPGMGRLFIESIASRDHTTIVGIVLVHALLISSCNFIADLLLTILNPRLRS
ncbi:MAG: ABC transporter permease [Puniceicoccales bacterium]|nr:ABC transporter permease [Puniceicoccales bacterium]